MDYTAPWQHPHQCKTVRSQAFAEVVHLSKPTEVYAEEYKCMKLLHAMSDRGPKSKIHVHQWQHTNTTTEKENGYSIKQQKMYSEGITSHGHDLHTQSRTWNSVLFSAGLKTAANCWPSCRWHMLYTTGDTGHFPTCTIWTHRNLSCHVAKGDFPISEAYLPEVGQVVLPVALSWSLLLAYSLQRLLYLPAFLLWYKVGFPGEHPLCLQGPGFLPDNLLLVLQSLKKKENH